MPIDISNYFNDFHQLLKNIGLDDDEDDEDRDDDFYDSNWM